MNSWYTRPFYYKFSLITAILLGVAVSTLFIISDNLKSCKDPYGISELCFQSDDCLEEHCLIMKCKGKTICVPDVATTCMLDAYVIFPGKCPFERGLYEQIFAITCAALFSLNGIIYIITRLLICAQRNKSYDSYPSLINTEQGQTCPECGTPGVLVSADCSDCGGLGMHTGTTSPIICKLCKGTGKLAKIKQTSTY